MAAIGTDNGNYLLRANRETIVIIAGKRQCPLCHKLVADKPLLGTLHLCLTDEEEAALGIY